MGAKFAKLRTPEQPNVDLEPEIPAISASAIDNEVPKPTFPTKDVEELMKALLADSVVRDRKVDQLLQSSNPNVTLDAAGLKPIHIAVISKNLHLLQQLLSNREFRPGEVNVVTAGMTPLHLAVQHIAPEIVLELLKQPAVLVNVKSATEKQTPLMLAISTDEVGTDEHKAEIVQMLVNDERCRLDETDSDRWIALTYAARVGNVPAALILVSEGRTQLYTIDQLLNAFRQAVLSGHEIVCDIIMSNLTLAQKNLLSEKIIKLKDQSHTTPLQKLLLAHAREVLDSGYVEEPSGPSWDALDQLLQVGSVVQLNRDSTLVRGLQRVLVTEGVGKWLDGAHDVIGARGIVRSIDLHGVLGVDFGYFDKKFSRIRFINPKAVQRLSQDGVSLVDADGNVVVQDDCVRLVSDESVFQLPEQKKYLGKPGMLKYLNNDGGALVIIAGNNWTLGPKQIRKIYSVASSDGSLVTPGDTVEVLPGKALVERLQTGIYGGWDVKSIVFLGKQGTVVRIACECNSVVPDPDCFIRVNINGSETSLNPKAVKLVSSSRPLSERNIVKDHCSAPDVRKSASDSALNAEEDRSALGSPVQRNKVDGNLDPVSRFIIDPKPIMEDLKSRGHTHSVRLTHSDENLPFHTASSTPPTSPGPVPRTPLSDYALVVTCIPFEQLKFGPKLQKGGFGTVYRARWNHSDVAVKIVNLQGDESLTEVVIKDEKRLVLKEAALHSNLVHPHIVQLLGISFNDADKLHLNAYIALKYIEGADLHGITFGFQKPHLTTTEKMAVAFQVCDAIRYLHDDAAIIHQDIKPGNIMIEERTKNAYVTDFGISQAKQLDVMMAMYTKNACGSLPYMAPELVAMGKGGLFRKATTKSDIWALGATFTELFTGQKLYGNPVPDMGTLLNLKSSEDVIPVAAAKAHVFYRVFLEPSMHLLPENRPSAAELNTLLEASQADVLMLSEDSEV